MASFILCVVLSFILWWLGDARANQVGGVTAPGRRLLQGTVNTVAARIRVVNFEVIVSSAGDAWVEEEELQGSINVTSSTEPVLYGAYYLLQVKWPR
jgi:hypothetical protein